MYLIKFVNIQNLWKYKILYLYLQKNLLKNKFIFKKILQNLKEAIIINKIKIKMIYQFQKKHLWM